MDLLLLVGTLGFGSEDGGSGLFGGVVRRHREAMWAVS